MFKYVVIPTLLCCTFACSSNDSPPSTELTKPASSSSSGSTDASNPQMISLTGADTGEIGQSLSVDIFQYRAMDIDVTDASISVENLFATNNAALADVIAVSVGTLDGKLVHLGQTPVSSSFLNVTPYSVNLEIEKEGKTWSYNLDCFEPTTGSVDDQVCADVVFDRANRTVTFDSAELPIEPYDDDNLATAPMILSGSLTWSNADEAPRSKPQSKFVPLEGSEDGLTLEEMTGLWDTSEDYGEQGIDESYLVVKDGQLWSYDFLGDSHDQGEACYEVSVSTIKDLGLGVFDVTDLEVGYTVQILGESNGSDGISLSFFFGSAEGKPYQGAALEFSPICVAD